MDVTVKVHLSGPIFDGRALKAVDDYLEAAIWEVGEQGEREVQQELAANLRHPTGRYQGHIKVERHPPGVIVHDQDLPYSFWLEGVPERRDRRHMFPGYHSFEHAGAALERVAGPIAERVLPPYLARMQ